jgi:PPOX class probable F420-dependent enzyme
MAAGSITRSMDNARFAVLTTFRRNGQPVATPIWFALDSERVVFFTGPGTGKARRIRNNPTVEIAPSTARGKLLGPPVSGTARLLVGTEAKVAERMLGARYGWQWKLWNVYERLRHMQRVYFEITAT